MNTKLRNASHAAAVLLILAVTPSAAQAPPGAPPGGPRGGATPGGPPQTAGQEFRRMAPIPAAQLTNEQKAAMEYYKSQRNMELRSGLWMDLLRVPVAMKSVFDLRLYIQKEISFGDALTEFAELLVLRKWNSRNEFGGHSGIALQAGVKAETIHAIAEGRYPVGMTADEAVIYHFISELMDNKNVSDPTYAAMIKRFGERGVIDAIALTTLYSAVGMVHNVVREPVPEIWAQLPDFPQAKPAPLSEYANPRRFQQPGGQGTPPAAPLRPAAPPPATN